MLHWVYDVVWLRPVQDERYRWRPIEIIGYTKRRNVGFGRYLAALEIIRQSPCTDLKSQLPLPIKFE